VSAQSAAVVSGRIVGESPLRIFGLPSAERLRRQLARASVLAPPETATRTVLLRADWVFDDALVRDLAKSDDDVALAADNGECVALIVSAARAEEGANALLERRAPAGMRVVNSTDISDGYNKTLRKREAPYLMPLDAATLPAIERRVFGAVYKGVTDLVTLYFWPAPALIVTRFCARAGITPNQVTSLSLVLVLAATYLFWHGHYLPGLAAAWVMTFLDTVDGKLARVSLLSTQFGNIFDHSIDLIHPPFWWWAWIVGLPAVGLSLVDANLVLTVIIGGYVVQRLEEGLFKVLFGVGMHVWRPFDSRFRLVTARRNPNLLLLTASMLFDRPDLGIVAVAAWTALSLLVHTVQMIQAAILRMRGPLRSWLLP
jgi:phosphatidylglycerophosphate synthase